MNRNFWGWLSGRMVKNDSAPKPPYPAPNDKPGNQASPRKLHIGGEEECPGWEILNAVPGPYVDHLGDARDLSQFPNNTFTAIYASHVVEHLDYAGELVATLKEWHRALAAGGKIYVSVPDLDVLARLFIRKDELTLAERYHVMRMMFGGHINSYDYHMVGLNQEFLASFLTQAGYVNLQKVEKFGFFQDTSRMIFKGVPISLNMIAEKPISEETLNKLC